MASDCKTSGPVVLLDETDSEVSELDCSIGGEGESLSPQATRVAERRTAASEAERQVVRVGLAMISPVIRVRILSGGGGVKR